MEHASTKPDRTTLTIEGVRLVNQLKRIPVAGSKYKLLGHVAVEGCGSLEEGEVMVLLNIYNK